MPPRIPERIGWQIVGLRRAGFTQNEIFRDLNIRQGTVSKILRRHSQRRTVKPTASSGRPRNTSARDDRILYRICRSNRMKSASVLRQLWQNRINIRLSRATVNRNCLREHLKRVNYHVGIWKRAHIAKPVYPEPTLDNDWQCVDGMIEPKWVSGDFIPQQLADVLVEGNIAGLTESDENDDKFDDVLYSLIDGEEEY